MEDNNKEMMYPSVEWMRRKYNQFNGEVFDGRLGDCDLSIMTSGRGSQGRTYGRFSLMNKSLMVDVNSRWMFIPNYGERIYINKDNFVKLCYPTISLNGHYRATEEAWENVLVHEMCHYYSYMYGKCPKQSHGPEFRDIAEYVSVMSVGRFNVHRLVTSEEKKDFKLDDDMVMKKEKRVENKKSNAIVVFVFRTDGNVEMSIFSRKNVGVLREIFEYYDNSENKSKVKKMLTSTDPTLIELLYQCGYRKILRTWRYWNVSGKSFVNNLSAYDCDEWINNLGESIIGMWVNKLDECIISNIINEAIDEYIDGLGDNDDNSIQVGGLDLSVMSPFEYYGNK